MPTVYRCEAIPESVCLNAQIREVCTPCVKAPAVIVTLNLLTADGAKVKFSAEVTSQRG